MAAPEIDGQKTAPAASAGSKTPDNNTGNKPVRRRRWPARLAIGLLVLVLLLAGAVYSLVFTDWGARNSWKLATRALSGALSGDVVGGSLAHGLDLRNVRWGNQTTSVRVDRIHGRWQLSLSPRKLTIAALELGKVDVTLQPSKEPSEPARLPARIHLPLEVDLQKLAIGEVAIHQGETTTTLTDLLLRAGSDRVHHSLTLEKLGTPWGAAQAALDLTGDAPFPLNGSASLDGAWQKHDYRIDTTLDGTLETPGVAVKASGGGDLRAEARIEATPFAPIPFRRARVAVEHLDPRLFSEAAPEADLRIDADIAPVAQAGAAGTTAPDLSQLRVAGPITITNARPGAIDQQLLPLVSLKAEASLTAEAQQLTGVEAALPGGARLVGGGELRAGGNGEFTLQARNLDLHALHRAVRPTRLNGPLKVALAGQNQQVQLELEGAPFLIQADASITPQQVELRSARLGAGAARLEASGTLGRDEAAAYSFKGTLASFDPAAFLATVQPPPAKGAATKKPARIPQADINMRFTAEGRLQPELLANLRFDIGDSSYDKLPMSGGGTLQLAGQQVPAADVQLLVAGNRISAKGGFGAPGRQLAFTIDAPALERLGFGLAGLLNAQGTLAGTLQRPTVQADLQAKQLAFGEYRLAQLTGRADMRGVPGEDPDARVKLAINGQGVKAGAVQLDRLDGDIDGSYASHAIRLQADGRINGSAAAVTLAANGALRQEKAGLGWEGTVRTLENRGVPRISMKQPLAVRAGPGQVTLGATRIDIEKALVSLESLDFSSDGPLRSQGTISALDMGHMLTLWKQISGSEPPVKTDLVLDAAWNFTLADSASGFLQVERKSGDLQLPAAARSTALGLRQLKLRGDFAGAALRLNAALDTARFGNAAAQGQVGLQPDGARLTVGPDSPLSVRVNAALPQLSALAALTGPRIALDGKLAANITAGGTLGAPVLSGEINGSQLALTLYDQGVRLRDGVARIILANNIAELREVVFRGGDGVLRATGRIPLDQASTDITATVVAEKLQLLADPSAQLTLSGQAKLENVGGQLQATGKFTVDRALFNLPEKSAPKLDDDVVVYRNGAKPSTQGSRAGPADKPSSPFSPVVDVQVDLGENFRFKGSGADLRLAGALSVRTGPSQPLEAYGTIRIPEGKYEAFGAVLDIERGLLNFTGPLTNPNINILAMRRRQEVAAGVQVTGTVQQPRVQLVSEPNVADEEKLSWLVFGHGGSGGGTNAQTAARSAATGLLNKLGGDKVAKRIGLDELSFGKSAYGMGSEQVVSLGKNISERLAIGYEQSLAGAASVLKLTYQLSRSWSVVLRGGQVAGLDLSYTRRFDKFGEIRGRR
ncbi:translocation/assembly module TamB domain-containing protein [Noviherbaspirillum sp. 1P10PC]|uniref:translocation/assembly module TamB domain-containing protein n=1 Tax=Noviherbaspirillum sp. 1P10PC TaxID=3132292 RepID=UPI0039A145CE